MNYLKRIPRIKKLARLLDMPLKSINFENGGARFVFIKKEEDVKEFDNADEGVVAISEMLEEKLKQKKQLDVRA